MSGEKIFLVKESIKFIINELKSANKVSLVTFSNKEVLLQQKEWI